MTFLATPNPGDPNWGPPLNASLNALQQRIDALSAKLPTATPGDAGKIISVSNTGAYQLTPSTASSARFVTADTTAASGETLIVPALGLTGQSVLTAAASVSTTNGAPANIVRAGHTDDPLQIKRNGFQLMAGLMAPAGYTGATFLDGAPDEITTQSDPGAVGSVLDFTFLNDPWSAETVGGSIAAAATGAVYVCIDVEAAAGTGFPNPGLPGLTVTNHTHAPLDGNFTNSGNLGATVVFAAVTLGSTPPTITTSGGPTWTLLLQQAIGSAGFLTIWQAHCTVLVAPGTDMILSETIDSSFMLNITSKNVITVHLPVAADGDEVTVINSTTAADAGNAAFASVVPSGSDTIKGVSPYDHVDRWDVESARRYFAAGGVWYPQSLTH